MKKTPNAIMALVYISESEIAKVIKDYRYNLENDDPELFKSFLYSVGIDISLPVIRQDTIQHRNRFNEVVTCSRWVGNERLDEYWIESGHASREAIDKASGSRLVEDVYRVRGLTEDMQERMESRDKYYEPEVEYEI